jgi:hypothetical protein
MTTSAGTPAEVLPAGLAPMLNAIGTSDEEYDQALYVLPSGFCAELKIELVLPCQLSAV